MGKTLKRNYDRYTLAFKLTAVRLANHPEVMSKCVAESLGLHPVMLYRWQMEYRKGELRENRHMKKGTSLPKRRTDPGQSQSEELTAAKRRIRQLEKSLAQREEELAILKKAKRFFAKAKR
jgi:transposase